MSFRRRWILYDHESVFYCVTFILGRYLMSHVFLFSGNVLMRLSILDTV